MHWRLWCHLDFGLAYLRRGQGTHVGCLGNGSAALPISDSDVSVTGDGA